MAEEFAAVLCLSPAGMSLFTSDEQSHSFESARLVTNLPTDGPIRVDMVCTSPTQVGQPETQALFEKLTGNGCIDTGSESPRSV